MPSRTIPLEEQDGAATRIAVLAKPPVRKMARDLGVDLRRVSPTGPNGTITREDVAAAAAPQDASRPRARALPPASREERVAVKGVRKMTAQAMVASAFTAPHVTEFLTVDVTRTVEFVERLRGHRAMAGLKVSPLLVIAKALCLAVRRTPEINASWDAETGEIVLKHYVNLGIAAATPRGLLVPNIKDADGLSLPQLAAALAELTATAREGRTAPADMSGGTITITNVGVFGVDAGTPIINPGEAAILCVGTIKPQPWVVDGAVVPRAGHDAVPLLRPPHGRRRGRVALPRRRRHHPRGPRRALSFDGTLLVVTLGAYAVRVRLTGSGAPVRGAGRLAGCASPSFSSTSPSRRPWPSGWRGGGGARRLVRGQRPRGAAGAVGARRVGVRRLGGAGRVAGRSRR